MAALASDWGAEDTDPQLELYADLAGPMLRGLTVSTKGRMFLAFPRIAGKGDYTLAELKDGKPVPYPNLEFNKADQAHPGDHIFSVMNAVADNKGRLWVADAARIGLKPVPGAIKIVGIDLAADKVIKTIMLPPEVVTDHTVLHDLRYDGTKGKDGAVVISDSAPGASSAIIVVDVESGTALRRLHGHKSVQPEAEFLPFINGRPLMRTMPDGEKTDYQVGVAGLALSPDGKTLYYCPQASRRIYSVDANLLCDPSVSEAKVEESVKDLGPKGAASDGMESDKQGNVYFTDYENSTVWLRKPSGDIQKVVHDARLLWPDTIWLAGDGYLYISSSQFNQLAAFNSGKDKRSNSYKIYRIKVAGTPKD